jgi:RNA polymerase sigma-70 factor, ECF subfamily
LGRNSRDTVSFFRGQRGVALVNKIARARPLLLVTGKSVAKRRFFEKKLDFFWIFFLSIGGKRNPNFSGLATSGQVKTSYGCFRSGHIAISEFSGGLMTDSGVNKDEGLGDETSLSLLVRLREQDQHAWERMVSLYSPLILRWCRRVGLTDDDAADVGQDVFLAVYRKIGVFHRDQEGDSFRGWLRKITRNQVFEFLRQRGAGQARGGDFAKQVFDKLPAAPMDGQDADERAVLYRRAIDLIRNDYEPRNWLAFWHVVVAGESVEEVARDLAMTPNAVYLCKSRILRRIRHEFSELIEPSATPEPSTAADDAEKRP